MLIHHVTAITADAQRNVDFYTGALGLRLVKLTVNFDDPSSYHLYYGDAAGNPGTILTFFAWPGGTAGRIGPPQVTVTAFRVPRGSLGFWSERLAQMNAAPSAPAERFGHEVISFKDPDGLELEIVASADNAPDHMVRGPIPAEHAIAGFDGITVSEDGYESTAKALVDVLGFVETGSEGAVFRYRGQSTGLGSFVDLRCVPGARRGVMGTGIVHHVAFRAADSNEQGAWRRKLVERGFNVSPVMDRQYFRSIYFREPGGVLFEIATDPPGFTVDEPAAALGTRLMLPPQYEAQRRHIEQLLPPLKLPQAQG